MKFLNIKRFFNGTPTQISENQWRIFASDPYNLTAHTDFNVTVIDQKNPPPPPIASGALIGGIVGGLLGLGALIGLGYGLYKKFIAQDGDSSEILLSDMKKGYQEKSWHFDPQTKAKRIAEDKIYELVETTDKDKCKVIEFYQHHPVPGYEMASVHVIYNPDMNHEFSLYMKKLQQRDNNPAFVAKWPTGRENMNGPIEPEEDTDWRGEVHQQFKTMAEAYQDTDYPSVNLLPIWHGTKTGIVDSIFRTGYANLATMDSGFFGKGIYGAHEAEYSYRVYAKEGGALILNWIACFSAYPVIDGDMEKLEGKGNYTNYDAHFIPVVPRNPDNPHEEVYHPTKPNERNQYTELVVFQSAACLPRYLVELQATLLKTVPPPSTGGYQGTFFPLTHDQKQKKEQVNQNISTSDEKFLGL